MEGINSQAKPNLRPFCVYVCMCALNQPFKNPARNMALLVIQLGQWARDGNFHNSVELVIQMTEDGDHRSPTVSDRCGQPTRALSRVAISTAEWQAWQTHTALACYHASYRGGNFKTKSERGLWEKSGELTESESEKETPQRSIMQTWRETDMVAKEDV